MYVISHMQVHSPDSLSFRYNAFFQRRSHGNEAFTSVPNSSTGQGETLFAPVEVVHVDSHVCTRLTGNVLSR